MEEKDPIFQDTKADDGSYKEPEKDITSSISERLSGEAVAETEQVVFIQRTLRLLIYLN